MFTNMMKMMYNNYSTIQIGAINLKNRNTNTLRLVEAGLMAAPCFVGYTLFPAFNASGTKVHFGNAFVVIAAYLLGGTYGGLAGAIGLVIADLVGGWAASAPRTFITKFVIGLIVGLVAHKIGHISDEDKKPADILKWTIIASIAGLGFNCVFEPGLKYVWYTFLFPNAEQAAKAIKALLAVTTYTTIINAVINTIAAVLLFNAIRPALKKAGLLINVK